MFPTGITTYKKLGLVIALLWLLSPSLVSAQLALANLELIGNSSLSIQYTNSIFNRATNQTSYTVTLTNTSSNSITGPIYLAISGITPSTVTLANAGGISVEGTPYLAITTTALAPSQTFTTKVIFSNPSRARFNFTGTAYHTPSVSATQIIGPQGGIVSVTDTSSSLFGTSVVVPPNALPTDTRISIAEATPPQLPSFFQATGPAVNFLPDGLTFAIPVTITLPTTDDVSNGSSLIYLLSESGAPVPEIAATDDESLESHGQIPNQTGSGLMVLTDHFSSRQVLSSTDINAALNAPFTPGIPVLVPILVAQCIRCISPRQVPIQQIIIHSTNDGGSSFANIISWIHRTIGLPTVRSQNGRIVQSEAFFATYYIDKSGRIVQLVDDNVQTAHIAGHNSGSIGIELYDDSSGYSLQQTEALVTLTLNLMKRHNLKPGDVFRHKDFTTDPYHQDPYHWTDSEWLAFKAQFKELFNSDPATCSGGALDKGGPTFGVVVLNTNTPGNVVAQVLVKNGSPNTTYSIWVNQYPGDCPTFPTATLVTDNQGTGNASVVETRVTGATHFWVSAQEEPFSTGKQILRSVAVALP
ncbi:MAG: N-acetylmuramoyl-L-alanine amidase [Candidatus Competibacteraceae bacterium]